MITTNTTENKDPVTEAIEEEIMSKVILCSMIVSGLVSFGMMRFQMRMMEKWLDSFFEKESEWNKETMRDFVRSIEKTIGGRR